MHILTVISRSKGNQAVEFGQLMKYNMRNIFLEKPYTECGGETISRPFPEKRSGTSLRASFLQDF